jgi:hypothetical protein
MKHLKQFESYQIYDDIKDYFLNLIDLGCSYNESSNIIELKKEKDCSITEIVSEVEQIVYKLDARIHKIQLKLDVNKFHLIVELKANLEFTIKVDRENKTLKVISIYKREREHFYEYMIKCMEKDSKISNINFTVSLPYIGRIRNKWDDDINFKYNNRKRGVKIDLKDMLNLFKEYDPSIKAIEFLTPLVNIKGE